MNTHEPNHKKLNENLKGKFIDAYAVIFGTTMKNISSSIIFCTIILLAGLIYWQVRHLQRSQQLTQEVRIQEAEDLLLECAIQIRTAEIKDTSLRTDTDRLIEITDEVVSRIFDQNQGATSWGVYNGLGEHKYGSQSPYLDTTSMRSCLSCLIMISILDENGDPDGDRGFVLQHSPVQMVERRGLDEKDLQYLHLSVQQQKNSIKAYIAPGLFLTGLTALFVWLFYLISKQKRLIKQKNEFVNHLSHQFQTPLSSIKLSANLLAEESTGTRGELVQIIQTESNRLENHIKTVLHWVKSDADRLYLNKSTVGITDIIEKSLRQMKSVFITNNTRINFIPPSEEMYIDVDSSHLQLMLFNIWENAIKHNESSIDIGVKCERSNNHIHIINTDTGQGMQDSNNGSTWKGLGLAYINKIMSEHGGSMELVSAPAAGLTVKLNFPIA